MKTILPATEGTENTEETKTFISTLPRLPDRRIRTHSPMYFSVPSVSSVAKRFAS